MKELTCRILTHLFLCLGCIIVTSLNTFASDPVIISSPDGNVQAQLFTIDNNRLGYEVTFNGYPVIERSSLGITVDKTDLGNGVSIGDAEVNEVNETYQWRGKHSTAVNHYKGIKIPVTHTASGTEYMVQLRVFNDGIALRYIVPGEGKRTVPGESTSFMIPAGSTVWYHGLASMHYEEKHTKSAISQIKAGVWAGPPLTVKLPNGHGYAAVTESGIISHGENFPGMALQADGKRGFRARLGHEHPENYPFILRYGEEEHKRLTDPPVFSGTIEGAWRVVMVGTDLNMLFNNDIVHNVAPNPDEELFPDGFNEEWLKPGRAVWGYLTDEPRTLKGMKNLSRLAGELGFEYHVVEGHWDDWPVEEQRELVEYSNQHNVKLLFWKHSRSLRTPEAREDFFSHLEEIGVAGAKVDFFDHEAKEIIDVYEACLREAAEHELILDFHGTNKPAGESRTWPNEMTREGVYGMEMRGPWATHNTTLPFTRMLAGHADYTALHFGDRRAETSETHQIASALVLQSPLLVYAEHPQNMLNHEAVEVIKQIPTVWDETIVLPSSKIGELSAFARRHGDKWFLSVMNGSEAKRIRIDLSFLGDGDYNTTMVRDEKPETAMVSLIDERESFGAPSGVRVNTTTVENEESLYIELIPAGGFVAVFTKAPDQED